MTKQVRDWHKDKEFMNKKAPLSYNDLGVICYEIAPYWHEEAAAEKDRADKAEQQIESLEREWRRAKYRAFNTEAREKKLREAIEEEVKCHILLGTYKRADELRELLASLYPKEVEAK